MTAKKVIATHKIAGKIYNHNQRYLSEFSRGDMESLRIYIDHQRYYCAFHWAPHFDASDLPEAVVLDAEDDNCIGMLCCRGKGIPNKAVAAKDFAKMAYPGYNGKVSIKLTKGHLVISLDGRTHFTDEQIAEVRARYAASAAALAA